MRRFPLVWLLLWAPVMLGLNALAIYAVVKLVRLAWGH